jgi:heme A synthase
MKQGNNEIIRPRLDRRILEWWPVAIILFGVTASVGLMALIAALPLWVIVRAFG